MMSKKAKLYLFPTLLGDGDYTPVLPQSNVDLIQNAECFIVEELRTARRFLRKIGFKKDFDQCQFFILNEHTDQKEVHNMLTPILQEGKDIFLMSEAGLPCIADPGAKVTSLAQRLGLEVCPLVGPSSIFLSLMASGFNGQNFAFLGYLPIKEGERNRYLHKIEERIYRENQTQIFIEAPYRNDKLFSAIKSLMRDETMLCVASDITLPSQSIRTKSIAQWKQDKDFLIGKRNTIFLLYK